MIEQIVAALLAGVSYSAIGYGKAVGEKFDIVKFVTTAVIGLIVGVVMVFMNVQAGEAYQYLFSMGAISLVQNIGLTINRRIIEANTSKAN